MAVKESNNNKDLDPSNASTSAPHYPSIISNKNIRAIDMLYIIENHISLWKVDGKLTVSCVWNDSQSSSLIQLQLNF